ncbi:hypothetical protein BLNAU_14195 [Blattamonas nauphoetae]|uniref:Uncharacterized protein n=1 Tax=Blattamonas nauphoetae TaxID=2049346 RepID=A0ABQ9XEJ7_9EUKA|nr:hypothetical protein BLNAU_14195 [Blattamonas nauphoetae]
MFPIVKAVIPHAHTRSIFIAISTSPATSTVMTSHQSVALRLSPSTHSSHLIRKLVRVSVQPKLARHSPIPVARSLPPSLNLIRALCVVSLSNFQLTAAQPHQQSIGKQEGLWEEWRAAGQLWNGHRLCRLLYDVKHSSLIVFFY